VPRVADLLQQLPIALVPRTESPQRLACFEQRFQVIKHQQHAQASQFRKQPAQAPLQALVLDILRLGREHRQAGREQRFGRRGVAQGAKEHHVGVGGLPTWAPPLCSTEPCADGAGGSESSTESQVSSSSIFWCAAFQSARISSSSWPKAQTCSLTARAINAWRWVALG